MKPKTYAVYGKKKGEARFRPFNMKDNKFVVNKIHMSLFSEGHKADLDKEMIYMNKANEEYTFELREV